MAKELSQVNVVREGTFKTEHHTLTYLLGVCDVTKNQLAVVSTQSVKAILQGPNTLQANSNG